MTAPFLFLTAALASGFALSSFLHLPQSILSAAFLATLLLAWTAFFFKKHLFSLAAVLLSVFLFGGLFFSVQEQDYSANPLRNLPPGSTVEVFGRLTQSPSRGLERDYIHITVEKIRSFGQTHSWPGRMRIAVLVTPEISSVRNLLVGDRVEISGQVGSLEGFSNFSPDPVTCWLRYKGAHQTVFAKSPLLVRRVSGGTELNPGRLISRLRRSLQDRIESYFSEKDGAISLPGAVLEALLLGERGRLPDPLTASLQKSGIFHLFAISGAHIGILSYILFALFGLFALPKRKRYGLLIPVLLLFALLVEGRPSVFRATIMTLSFLVGKLFWKDTHLLNILAASAFALLILNPSDLFSAGFQLTYAATLSIILLFPKISKYLPRLPLRISEIFAISVTAQLGVIPIMAVVFNRVTFSSVILNFAALPLVAVLMVLGFFFLGLTFICAPAAQAAAVLITHLTSMLTWLSHLLDGFTLMSYRIPNPSAWAIVGYYLSLAAFLVPLKKRKFNLLKWLIFLFFFIVITTHPFRAANKNLRLTFLDVGQGESILIEFPGSKTMLVDGGGFPHSRFDVGEAVVSRLLWRKGLKSIDVLALTHAHPDHILGMISVAGNFKIKEFWDSLPPQNKTDYDRLLKSLPPATDLRQRLQGYRTSLGGVRIEVLHPQADEDPDPRFTMIYPWY